MYAPPRRTDWSQLLPGGDGAGLGAELESVTFSMPGRYIRKIEERVKVADDAIAGIMLGETKAGK